MATVRRFATGMTRASRSARAKAKAESVYEAPLVLPPTGPPTHTAVLLHGMYRRGSDFEKLKDQFAQLSIPASGVKCIFPNSPTISISWPWCKEDGVYAWYNYYTCKNGCEEHDEIDMSQLEEQSKRVCSILDEELACLGDDARRLIIGGNSQGGTVALHAAMAYGRTLGAIIAMRTCLIDTVTSVSPSLKDTPIFIFAAERDGVYTLSLQRRCFRKFEDLGYQVAGHNHAVACSA
eukprot:6183402-Pleurochrysis_carterae.AAC.1